MNLKKRIAALLCVTLTLSSCAAANTQNAADTAVSEPIVSETEEKAAVETAEAEPITANSSQAIFIEAYDNTTDKIISVLTGGAADGINFESFLTEAACRENDLEILLEMPITTDAFKISLEMKNTNDAEKTASALFYADLTEAVFLFDSPEKHSAYRSALSELSYDPDDLPSEISDAFSYLEPFIELSAAAQYDITSGSFNEELISESNDKITYSKSVSGSEALQLFTMASDEEMEYLTKSPIAILGHGSDMTINYEITADKELCVIDSFDISFGFAAGDSLSENYSLAYDISDPSEMFIEFNINGEKTKLTASAEHSDGKLTDVFTIKKYCDDDDDEEIKTYKMTASDSKWELSAVSGEEEKVSANGTYTLSDSSVKIAFENITYEGELKSTDIDLTFKSYSDKISKPDTDSYELDADKTFNTAVSEAKQVFKSMILSTDSDITESVNASNQDELDSKAKSLCTNALTFAANLDMAGLTLPDSIICGSLSTEKTDEKPEKTADEDGFRKQMNYMMGGDVVEYFYAVSIKRGYPSHVIVSTSEDKIKAAGNDPDSWKASEDGTLGYFKETIGS